MNGLKLEHCWNQCSKKVLISFFSPPNEEGPPQIQGKLPCWFDQLENIAFQAEYFLLSQNTLVHASADGRKSAGESPDGAMMWPMCKCFSPMGHCHVDDAQEAMLWLYPHGKAMKMATKDIDCPPIQHHYRESWIFSQKFLRHIIVTKTPGWFPFPQGGRSMIKLNASLWKMITDGVDDKYHEFVVQILSYILMYSYASRWPPW